MNAKEAGMVFRAVVKGVNFITPSVVTYGSAGKYVYELSKGTGMNGGDIYGVTVVDAEKMSRTDLSKCFFKLADALARIEKLRKGELDA